MYFRIDAYIQDILFSGWTAKSWEDVLISSLVICLLTIIFEGLKTVKLYVMTRRTHNFVTEDEHSDSHGLGSDLMSSHAELLSSLRIPVDTQQLKRKKLLVFLVEAVLHMFNFLFAYILMLIVMTYSVWFLLAVILGSGVGFLITQPFIQRLTAKYSSLKKQVSPSGYSENSALAQSQRNYQSFSQH